MNAFPSFLKDMAEDWLSGRTLSAVWTTTAYSTAIDFLNDVTAVGAADTIPGVSVNASVEWLTTAVSEATALEMTGVGTSTPIGLVIYDSTTGLASTSPVVAYLDRRAGNSPIEFTNDNGTVRVWWPSGVFMAGG